jgi:hypothetical protein
MSSDPFEPLPDSTFDELSTAFVTDQYLTETQLAKLLNVGIKRVEHWRKGDTGPSYVILNGAVRYSVRVIEKYLRDNTITPLRAPIHGRGNVHKSLQRKNMIAQREATLAEIARMRKVKEKLRHLTAERPGWPPRSTPSP